MYKSTFTIKKLDCPCEEALIRTQLQDIKGILKQEYDLENRSLTIYHEGEPSLIAGRIDELRLGSQLVESLSVEPDALGLTHSGEEQNRKVLLLVLAINFALFVVEVVVGYFAGSMALVADSLDMLADATVYGLSLWAIGATASRKRGVARFAGYVQIALALLGFAEVIRRFVALEQMPSSVLMMTISLLALVGNASCLWLLQRTKSREAHIQASLIFSSNDVIINCGVIVAGLLVWLMANPLPDLIVGCIVFVLVSWGAWRILRLA